jgi:hypothetical protein
MRLPEHTGSSMTPGPTLLSRLDTLVNDQVRPFTRNRRVDLTAPDTPILASGRFIIYQNRTQKGQVEIVRAVVPYAEERTDVGTPAESFRKILPEDGDNFFAFTPLQNGQPAFVSQLDFNAPRNAAGPLRNAERQVRAGFTNLSTRPLADVMRGWPNWFTLAVPSQTEFVVTFELMPPSVDAAAALSNPYQIGAGSKRVDFAGVLVAGVLMPQQLFDKLTEAEAAINEEG